MGKKAKEMEAKEAAGAGTAEALVTKVEAAEDLELDSTVKAPATEEEEKRDFKQLEKMEKNGDPEAIKEAIEGAEAGSKPPPAKNGVDASIGLVDAGDERSSVIVVPADDGTSNA